VKELNRCLVCGSNELVEYFNLGLQPLVNNLKDSKEEKDFAYPLEVNVCPKCFHRQLSIAIDKSILFNNYMYKTGESQSHIDFFSRIVKVISVKGKGSVLDIGCNDGTLLKEFKINGWGVLGVEPSANLADLTRSKFIDVVQDFFPTDELLGRTFDCITAFNVFAHNDDPFMFLMHMADLLTKDGRIYILTTLDTIDNFYHEHISYFNPLSMSLLAYKCGLQINSIVETPMHGRSYLFEMSHRKELFIPNKISKVRKDGRPIVAYGASAGGTVLLNYFGISPEYVVDDNTMKQGKYLPGVSSRVCDKATIELDTRDLAIIITAHNLFDEIKRKIKILRPNKSDVFINLVSGSESV